MRKLFILFAVSLITIVAWSQSPEKMNYQAIIRNSSSGLVTSSIVGMRISILQGSSSGTPVYIETQTPTSNINGLVTIEIGGGTPATGAFSDIDWADGPYFIKTETDPAGGTNYTITGTSQLLSVPYAMHSKTSENGTVWSQNGSDIYYNDGNVGIGTSNPETYIHAHGLPIISRGQLSLSSPASEDIFLSFYEANNFKAYLWYEVNDEDLRLQNFTSGDLNLNPYGGNVGIGTNNPTSKLEVAGQIKITGGTPAMGQVLTSDGVGLATWEPPANSSVNQIYFEVKRNASYNWTISGTTEKINFSSNSTVWKNEGNGFNTTTSRFTAPEDGIYTFNGAIDFEGITPGYLIYAFLQAGGKAYEGAHKSASGTREGVVISMTIYLTAGQTAELWGYVNDPNPPMQVYGNTSPTYAFTYFSGAKVH